MLSNICRLPDDPATVIDIISIEKTCNWNPCVWKVELTNGTSLDVYYRYFDLEIRIYKEEQHREDMELICIYEDVSEDEFNILAINMLPYLLKTMQTLNDAKHSSVE
jgi:hypothetical protein